MIPNVYTAKWEDINYLSEREVCSDKEDIFTSLLSPGDGGGDTLYTYPAISDKFSQYLREPNYGLLMVVKFDKDIAGYLALRSFDKQNYIDSIHVFSEYRRRGCGKLLVQKAVKLPDQLSQYRRKVTTAVVRERDLTGQVFYRSCSFKCERILRNFFDLPPEDGYLFRMRT